MIYLAPFPTLMSMRSSNTYKERSLGQYDDDEDIGRTRKHGWRYVPLPSKSDRKFLRGQWQTIQSWDVGCMIFATFLILTFEMFPGTPESSSIGMIFPTLLEVTSAYRNVGISMGVASDGYSLSGSWSVSRSHQILVHMHNADDQLSGTVGLSCRSS